MTRNKARAYREPCIGTYRQHYATVSDVIAAARISASFAHLSDSVIRGFLLFHAQRYVLGQRSRSRYVPPVYEDVVCGKCKGKGWFGRGRPECPECNGIGRSANLRNGYWIEPSRSGAEYRQFDAWKDCGGLNGLAKFNPRPFMQRLFDCVNHTRREGWERVPEPKVSSHADEKRWWAGRIANDRGRFDPDWCMARMALRFGCTCPVTGEYVSRDSVSTPSPYGERLIAPLGFVRAIGVVGGPGLSVVASPLSDRGRQVIARSVNQWHKSNHGPCPPEWVLADVMKNQIFKRVA